LLPASDVRDESAPAATATVAALITQPGDRAPETDAAIAALVIQNPDRLLWMPALRSSNRPSWMLLQLAHQVVMFVM
jgi:hypothetical protein